MDAIKLRRHPAPAALRPPQFWDLVLADLALQMTGETYAAWLSGTYAARHADGTLTVQVRDQRAKDWLENRLAGRIQKTVDYYADGPLQVRFVTNGEKGQADGEGTRRPLNH